MRRFKKFLAPALFALVGAAVVFMSGPSGVTSAQLKVQYDAEDVVYFSQFAEDDTTSTNNQPQEIWVKYVGPEEGGTVDLNANGIEFFSGVLGSEAAPATTDTDDVNRSATADDICAANRGALDVTDAQCLTPALIVGVINDAEFNTDWVAVLGDIVGDDTTPLAAELEDPADAQAKLPGGLALQYDHSDIDTMAMLIRPDTGRADRPNTNDTGKGDIEFFLNEPSTNSYIQTKKDNPFSGMQVALTYVTAWVDSTTAWRLRIYAVKYEPDGRRNERLVFQRDDTTDVTDYNVDFSNAPLVSAPGETFLIQVFDDALITARISASGFFIYTGRH